MSRRVGVVIVGYGSAGRQHARAVALAGIANEMVPEIRGVVDMSDDKAAEGAHALGVPQMTFDGALADDRVDAVSICTPPGSHCKLALAALKAGKAVLIEKPVVAGVAELDQIVAAAHQANRPAFAMLQHRGRLPREATAQPWTADACASVVVMRHRSSAHYETAAWRSDPRDAVGGHVAHLAVHQIDLACQLLGTPTEVVGLFDCRDVPDIETRSAFVVRFEGGGLMTVLASAHPAPRVDELRVMDAERELTVGMFMTRYRDREFVHELSADAETLRADVYREFCEAVVRRRVGGRYCVERARGVTLVLEQVRRALENLAIAR